MNEDPNTTREVHFKLDTDSDEVSDSSSQSSDSSDISKEKDSKKNTKKSKKSNLNTSAPSHTITNVSQAALPILIKKQLDSQSHEIQQLRNLIKEQDLKLRLRKNDFDRVHSIEQKKEIMQHKERTEALYRHKLDDEKRKLINNKMEELDNMMQENKNLRDEIARMRMTMNK